MDKQKLLKALSDNQVPVLDGKISVNDLDKVIRVITAEKEIEIHWSKSLDDHANDEEIEMQDDQIAHIVSQHPNSEGCVMFPEEYSCLNCNYAVVYSPKDADPEEVAKKLMEE